MAMDGAGLEDVSDSHALLGADGRSLVTPREGRLRSRFAGPVLAVLLPLLAGGALFAVHLIAPQQSEAAMQEDSASIAQRKWGGGFLCDVCAVGKCDRGEKSDGPCVWYPPPIDPQGAYHCRVEHCSDVSAGDALSQCWQYNGNSYYSLFDKSAACNLVDYTEKPSKRRTLRSTSTETATATPTHTTTRTPRATTPTQTTTRTATSTSTHTATPEATVTTTATTSATTTTQAPAVDKVDHSAGNAHRATDRSEARARVLDLEGEQTVVSEKEHKVSAAKEKNTEEKKEKEEKEKEHKVSAAKEKNTEEKKEKEEKEDEEEEKEEHQHGAGVGSIAPERSMLDFLGAEASEIAQEAEARDPRLASYWDVGTCGPLGEQGDDNNKDWCGGLTFKPVCKDVVLVNFTTCSSGKALLAYRSWAHSKEPRVWLRGCEFMYFAQYECIASTTTTSTVSSTTTSSSSSSTSVSSTTTSSSSVSTSTTTSSSSSSTSSSSTSRSTTSTSSSTSTASSTSSTTSTTTALPGSCLQPVLGSEYDTSDCAGIFPNGTCVVRCAFGYLGGEEVFACTDEDNGSEGDAPHCMSSTTTTSTTTLTITTTWATTTNVLEGRMLDKERQLESRLRSGRNWSIDAGFPPNCSHKFKVPDPPLLATDFNGIRVPDVCFEAQGPHYVYVIGDWGGTMTPTGPTPANQRAPHTQVHGVDDVAQQRVAAQMANRAKHRAPDYILNVGDNFYWAGLDIQCGAAPAYQLMPTGQFHWNFEMIYVGEGIEGKPWLSVLGNHDYGGYMFNKGWDQQISYTWSPEGRWMMPAQYWATKVHYPGFSVDYFFLDTNYLEAHEPHADPSHNICSKEHVVTNSSGGCGKEGPKDVWDCPDWFQRLKKAQEPWFEAEIDKSVADWQIVVTHFPPTWERERWVKMSRKYGIDLIVAGHEHKLDIHPPGSTNFLSPTAYIVSGGGGGITSEGFPDHEGYDDQYGFHELTLSKDMIVIQAISHGGIQRALEFVRPVPRAPRANKTRNVTNKTRNVTNSTGNSSRTRNATTIAEKKERNGTKDGDQEDEPKKFFFFKRRK